MGGFSREPRIAFSDIKLRIVEDGHDGLLAWASCVVNGSILLNNIAIRRSQDRGLRLSFPAKRTAAGTRFNYYHPINAEASKALERAIFGALREIASQAPPGPMAEEG